MATVGNNNNGEYSHLRDSFFTKGEEEQFKQRMQEPKEQIIHHSLLKQNVDKLYEKAMDLVQRVEQGEFNEEEMEKVERAIAHYLAAIDDLHLELVHEKYHNDELVME